MKGETSVVVEAHGHLIDSGLLNTIFDAVIAHEGAFEVQKFEIGRTNNDFSELVLRVSAFSSEQLDRILEALLPLGCAPVVQTDALVREADMDGAVPEDFYSTTNHRTAVRVDGRWLDVHHQRMDAIVVVSADRTRARLPQAARCAQGRPGGLRHRRHPHRSRIPGARPAALRVHGQRHLVGAARRGVGGPHRASDARRSRAWRPHRLRGRTGRRAHRRRAVLLAADSHRLGGRAAGRQRHRRARHRVVLLRHVARRRPRAGDAGARGPQAPHEGDQPGQPRRRHRAGGRVRACSRAA